MKTRSLVLIGVLVIALAAMAMPVMAADSATQTTSVTGSIDKSVTLTNLGATTSITFGATTGDKTAQATFDASTNCPGSITAVDDYAANSKPAGTAGYMSNYTAGYVTTPATALHAMLAAQGTTKAPFTSAGSQTDLSTAQNLFTFNSIGSNTGITITFTQHIDADTDVALPSTNTYRIPIKMIISCA